MEVELVGVLGEAVDSEEEVVECEELALFGLEEFLHFLVVADAETELVLEGESLELGMLESVEFDLGVDERVPWRAIAGTAFQHLCPWGLWGS